MTKNIKKYLLVFATIFAFGLAGCESEKPNAANNEPKNETSNTEPKSKSENENENETAKKDSKTVSTDEEPKSEVKEYIIDVRSKKEWDRGHVKNAIHIPHTEIVERIGEVTTDKDAKLYFY